MESSLNHDIVDDLNEFINDTFNCDDDIDIDKMLTFDDMDHDEDIIVDYEDILLCLGFNDEPMIADDFDIEKLFQDFKSNDFEALPELMVSDIDFM